MERNRVRPFEGTPRKSSMTSLVCRKSKPSKGSSSKSKGCGVSRPSANNVRFNSPLESDPTRDFRNSSSFSELASAAPAPFDLAYSASKKDSSQPTDWSRQG